MSQNLSFGYVAVLLFVLLVVKTQSQNDDDHLRSQTKAEAQDCDCIYIRRCYILRYRRDWRTAGETCEFGYGEYRKVCCPDRRRVPLTGGSAGNPGQGNPPEAAPVPAPTPAPTPAPPPPPPPPTIDTTNENNGGNRYPSAAGDRLTDQRRPGSLACDCIHIRACSILRLRKDWQTAGRTCGFGFGEFRKVCCPNSTPVPVPPKENPDTTNRGNGDCGRSIYNTSLNPLIMGGEPATEGLFPWMTALRIRGRTDYYAAWCSAFLIDRRHVLSAAHCFDETDPRKYVARIGRVNQNEADEYRIERLVVHPGYVPGSNTFYNDIAVLTLEREVNFPDFNPICLPDEQVSALDLTSRGATVAGWGADKPKSQGGKQQDVLQYLTRLPIMTTPLCQRRLLQTLGDSYRRQFPRGVTNGFICAAFEQGGKDACGGDSGGPLMIQNNNRWYAVGVVSFGYECGLPGVPGGYTKISKYLDWIKENTYN